MNWPWSKRVEVPTPKPDSNTALVLEMLAIEPLTVTMISRQTGMHRMTIKGILTVLSDLGYVYPIAVPPSILYNIREGMYAANDGVK